MNYEHINDCWNAIRQAKTYDEVCKLFDEFPRWSGDWSIEVEDGSYVVYNTYWDKDLGQEETDAETLDIDLEDEVKTYKIKVTSVDYCVEKEDVCEKICEDVTIEEDSEEFYDAIHEEIERVKTSLPQELELEIECEPEDLEDQIADAISEETGWLNNSFTYEIVKII